MKHANLNGGDLVSTHYFGVAKCEIMDLVGSVLKFYSLSYCCDEILDVFNSLAHYNYAGLKST